MVKAIKGRFRALPPALLAAALLASGCGTKGSLVLPKKPVVPVRTEAPSTPTPAAGAPRTTVGDNNKPASQDRSQ